MQVAASAIQSTYGAALSSANKTAESSPTSAVSDYAVQPAASSPVLSAFFQTLSQINQPSTSSSSAQNPLSNSLNAPQDQVASNLPIQNQLSSNDTTSALQAFTYALFQNLQANPTLVPSTAKTTVPASGTAPSGGLTPLSPAIAGNNTSYIKQFSSATTGYVNWIYKTISGIKYITPSTNNDVYLPKDLTVIGSINNPSDIKIKENIYDLTNDFCNNILKIIPKKYNFITAEQLIAYSLGEDNLPTKSCYLTFDDGFKDHINYVMPELLNRKIQGSFFPSAESIENAKLLDVHAIHFILASINDYKKLIAELNIMCMEFGYTKSDLNLFQKIYLVQGKYDSAEIIYIKNMLQHVLPKSSRSIIISHFFKKYLGQNMNQFAKELYMSIPDIKKLIENGMYVGSHGYSHEWLDKLKKSQIKKEIELSLKFLKKVGANIKNWIMCYPFGEYNQDVIDILKSKNCAISLTGKSGMANLDPKKMLVLNRFDTNDYPQ